MDNWSEGDSITLLDYLHRIAAAQERQADALENLADMTAMERLAEAVEMLMRPNPDSAIYTIRDIVNAIREAGRVC